jgi:hypothetical protein
MSGIGSAFKQFIMPFSVLSENRKEPFTADLKAAALFSLAEFERSKSGGLLSKKPEENISFIAETGYPLWLFPWSETTLIFDGLNRSSFTLNYPEIPDVNSFIENLKRCSKTRETYSAFLADHVNYFQAPTTEKSITIKGLIGDPEFLDEFDSYRHEATPIEDQPDSVILLSPLIDETTISSTLDELRTLYISFKGDKDRLRQSIKLLNTATRHYIKVLHDKTRAIKVDYKVRIKAQEKIITPKIAQLKEKYDKQIVQSTKKFEKQHLPLQKRKVKLEKSHEQALMKIEDYKLEAKSRAEKDDAVGEQKWKEKANEKKKELSQIEEQLKEAEKDLRDLGDRKSLEIFNFRSELETETREARQPLLDLESDREAKIQLCRLEIEKLEQQTKLMLDLLGRATKLSEIGIENFEKLGIKQDSELTDVVLFYIPFYTVLFNMESKKRYRFYPPSKANNVSLSAKLKGALGRSKIKQLLVPRFDIISSLVDTLQVLVQQNTVFETEISEMGEKANILEVTSMPERIRKGLEHLKGEGWISEKEYQILVERI